MLAFFQTPYIEKFVSVISQRRVLSTSPFYKNILKLQVNSVFGRSLLQKGNQLIVRIATTENQLQELFRNPFFSVHIIINKNVVAVCLNKKSMYLNTPIYSGMCVLDISKVHMYRFFYDVLHKHRRRNHSKLHRHGQPSALYSHRTRRI